MSKKVYEYDFYGKKIVVEHGELAKQASGSVLVRYNDTVILTATVINKKANLLSDFFPLTVNYQEKLYSVGKIPGGFIKREGRPTEAATLAARMIDRPMRPLFKEDFKNEVQVINTVLSVDQDCSPELTAMLGSSIATMISGAPFLGPIAGVKVGYIDGEYIINPTVEELEKSELDLTVAGTFDAINMVEAGAKQVDEEIMLEGLMKGHEAVKELCKWESEIISDIGVTPFEYESLTIEDNLRDEVTNLIEKDLDEALRIKEKLERYGKIDEIKDNLLEKYREDNKDLEDEELDLLLVKVEKIFSDVEYRLFRNIVVKEKIRSDGRKMDEIRPLSTDIDLLPRTHGSALFTRGETQCLAVTTLGALGEHQILDGLSLEDEKRFMLHYNFPQFSVGETGRYGAPGRREIGHGALGERALLQVIPSEDEFPYTIRVVSEILESNGSSSQASICAGCMSLMAAGVPIKSPVAGIAMGLITNDDDYTILTDIAGMEDHLGDMDFKVAGTSTGICALQMDIKIKGVTKEILKEALEQAKKARLEILEVIKKQIPEPRKEVSKYAPKTKVFYINPSKIRDVIGKGGEMITKIICDASNVTDVNNINAVKVDLEDDGRVIVYHSDQDIIDKTVKMIEDVAREVEVGKVYEAKVVAVHDFGCFVEVWPGCEGLVHVSQLDTKHIDRVEDVVKEGDTILVKAIGKDKKGKENFSRKEVLLDMKKKKSKE
ncbi:MAG TPA: polyribonucleotide nucleotidyltransferase [Candidatus Onthousia excrementipullorum]|uniref:Polyribonucleotide nucleotidyltransferase n=1 Tax=Candidatus Onthousia excrementipullorum TaxID=2840884 RepID=A0A9D1DVD9_9FIRM|nr:polyribonucleotide nucleotidyltransferase [Candidatus Onthousia excrementipullorum]